MKEIELKFFDINLELMINKIIDLGAKFKYESTLDAVFLSKSDLSLKEVLRIRKKIIDSKEIVEVTYKGAIDKHSNFKIREEVEFNSSNYKETLKFFEKLGYKICNTTSKKRVHYQLGDICFEFDTVLNYPTYLEIETQNEKDMVEICEKLGLDISLGSNLSVKKYYSK